MPHVVLGVSIVLTGTLVGVEFCVAVFVGPVVDRLPGSGGLTARADSARVLGAVMPFWYAAALATACISSALLWATASGSLTTITAALLGITIVLSVTVLVPINNRVKRWSTSDHPDDWRTHVHRWDRWNNVRVVLAFAGFALLVVAALIPLA